MRFNFRFPIRSCSMFISFFSHLLHLLTVRFYFLSFSKLNLIIVFDFPLIVEECHQSFFFSFSRSDGVFPSIVSPFSHDCSILILHFVDNAFYSLNLNQNNVYILQSGTFSNNNNQCITEPKFRNHHQFYSENIFL